VLAHGGPEKGWQLLPLGFWICQRNCEQTATVSQLCTGLEPNSHSSVSCEQGLPGAGTVAGQGETGPLSTQLSLHPPSPLLLPLLPLALPLAPPLPLPLPLLPLVAPLLLPLPPPLPAPLLPPPSSSALVNTAPPHASGSTPSGTVSTIPHSAFLIP
jgi:hypothetical protein